MADSDLASLTSSPQVFSSNRTLPQIRSLHKSLHVQTEEKAARLRTQVGSSYRELLGTADTIVQMRSDNDAVQELLGKIGGRCGRAVITSKASGLAEFDARAEKSRKFDVARLNLLDKCNLTVTRILKGGGGLGSSVTRGDRLVHATKILVLARLLIKSLAEETADQSLQDTIDTARNRMGTLRRRLLRAVENVWEQEGEGATKDDVLKALCAYSLANSSGAKDVLRRFLQVREETMALALEVEEGERERRAEDVTRSLKLYTRTLLDVQTLVPSRLSQALNGLKMRPLLDDPALNQLETIRLDIYGQWCGDEIKYFTPFIRHDDLDGKQAREMLGAWTEKGSVVLLGGLKKTLERMMEFKSIIDLRTSLLQQWIKDGSRAKGVDPSDMQDDLREAINARMLVVLETKVSKLRLVSSEVRATLDGWRDGVTDKRAGLWDEDGYDAALGNGAGPFIQEVVDRVYGRSDVVSKATHCYQSWYQVIDDVRDVVESLTKQRWDNDFDEIEDEETIETRQQQLSKDDPRMLQEKLNTTLDKSFKDLEWYIEHMWQDKAQSSTSGGMAMYLLRVLRDIRKKLPDRPSIGKFGLGMVPSLHSKVVGVVSVSSLETFANEGLSDWTVPGRALWEGEPNLPTQPSPHVFRFLRNLSDSMAEAGMDIWSPTAAGVMKKHLSARLSETWRDALTKISSEPSPKNKRSQPQSENAKDGDGQDGEEAPESEEESTASRPTEELLRDLHLQWSLDVSYIQCCLGSEAEKLNGLQRSLHERASLDDEASKQRLAKSAKDYWQRTSLLFGLLA